MQLCMSTVWPVLVPLVKRSEGLRLNSYRDAVGVWTIGYGHTKTAREGMTITQEEADSLLLADVQHAVMGTLSILPILATLPAPCIAAISDFTFNLGAGRLQASTLRRRISAQQYDEVPYELRRWVFAAGRKLPGLVVRREDEVTLWESGLEQTRSATAAGLQVGR